MVEKNYIAELFAGKCCDAKAKIIKAALEEFGIRSLAAARTRQIAARAGVNHAAINYYFGGKKELYLEMVRQIADFDMDYSMQFYRRGEELADSSDPSPEEARRILEDYIIGHLWPEDSQMNSIIRHAVLIVTREEMYQTDAFDILYENCFKHGYAFLDKMIQIASRGKFKGIDSIVTAEMLMGSIILFNSNRAAFKRLNKLEKFGDSEVETVRLNFKRLIESVLS